jgi:hypothetical protein
VTQRQRRKLSAVDDPLGTSADAPPETVPAPPDGRPVHRKAHAGRSDRQALFVRLPTAEADALARAAFELRLHKREIVAALVAQYVDARSVDGLSRVARLVEGYRRERPERR